MNIKNIYFEYVKLNLLEDLKFVKRIMKQDSDI